MSSSCCHQKKDAHAQSWWKRIDWLFGLCAPIVLISYLVFWIGASTLDQHFPALFHFTHAVFELLNTMWWGVLLGIVMLSLLSRVPRELVVAVLGDKPGVIGLFRATAAGVLLDLCSHGILMVGSKLYERGASAGQVMAFLIASPWNSFSLTLILFALIGVGWTLVYILLSVVIAISSGLIFDKLVVQGKLPTNPNRISLDKDHSVWLQARDHWTSASFSRKDGLSMLQQGIVDSKMVIRWLLFGIVLAALIRTFVEAEQFSALFGPSLLGLSLTILAATVIEVCSEGSTPLAADIVNNAKAPGNGFAFLMAGVSTDYTEFMVIKGFTQSWRFALMLPVITLPQIVIIAALLNASL